MRKEKYQLNLEDCCHGQILNSESNEFVCLVETKRPDLGFSELESILNKINRVDESFKLDDKQQIVLEIMKDIQKRWPHFHPSSVVNTLMELESEYYDELTKIEELQVFQVFIKWALEHENLVR